MIEYHERKSSGTAASGKSGGAIATTGGGGDGTTSVGGGGGGSEGGVRGGGSGERKRKGRGGDGGDGGDEGNGDDEDGAGWGDDANEGGWSGNGPENSENTVADDVDLEWDGDLEAETCALCHGAHNGSEGQGPLLPHPIVMVKNADGEVTQRVWVHEACANLSPEVFKNGDDAYCNLIKSIRRGRLIKCHGCSQRGATIGCFEPKCPKSFHAICALNDGWNFAAMGGTHLFACKTHRKNGLKQLGIGEEGGGGNKKKKMKKERPQKQDTPSEELYCLCQKPMDENTDEFWLGCEGGCDGWFHPQCIGLSEEAAKAKDDYTCASCVKKQEQEQEAVAAQQAMLAKKRARPSPISAASSSSSSSSSSASSSSSPSSSPSMSPAVASATSATSSSSAVSSSFSEGAADSGLGSAAGPSSMGAAVGAAAGAAAGVGGAGVAGEVGVETKSDDGTSIKRHRARKD